MKNKAIRQVIRFRGSQARWAQGRNVVVIGGGTGTYTVLSGLKKYPVSLTAIVSMADDGGSTKILREEFGVLPPGSVRPALVALSEEKELLARLFNFRFTNGSLKEHNVGNLFITALASQLGSFEKAIEAAGKILQAKGKVIPCTLANVRLAAKLEDGTIVKGETNIDVPKHNGALAIKKAWLEPKAKANPKAVESLKEADLIVIGPGDLYSSIVPNFLAQGLKQAFQKAKGKKVYVCNIMTKFGETSGFQALDFLKAIEQYVGKDVLDYVLVNKTRPGKERVRKYEKEKAEFVKYEARDFKGRKTKLIAKDLMRPSGFIRHDPEKLAKTLYSLLS